MKISLLIIVLLMVPWAYAIQTSVYIEFPDRLEGQCFDVKPSASAKQILEMTNHSFGFKFSGGFLNSIDNFSCSKEKCWFFYYDGIYSNYGIKDIKNKTMLYFGYYRYGKDFKPMGSPKNVSLIQECSEGKIVKKRISLWWLLLLTIPVIVHFHKK